jgi:asparagine N-glycosylation enzyme membrane subunit Stt3
MRLAWWGFVVVGLVLIGAGAYTTITSQSTINYCHSLIRTLACGPSGQGGAQPRFFMSAASTVTLQEAEFAWAVGLVVLALGLVSIAYGAISQSRPEKVALASA